MLEDVPFVNRQLSGHEKAAGAAPLSMNVIVDAAGAVRRRPGIKAHSGAVSTAIDANGLDALYATANGTLYGVGGVAAGGRNVYKMSATATRTMTPQILGNKRPTIAETEALLVLCSGGLVYKVDLGTDALAQLGGSPPEGTHVIANDGRLLVNDNVDRGNIYFSGKAFGSATAGHEQWNGTGTSGFFSAAGRPDYIEAVHESTNDIFAFGGTTLQVFTPEPADVATFAPAAAREYGCIAPYSVVKKEQSFMWLDDKRRFVVSDGREVDDKLGIPIQRNLDEMSVVSDCIGYRVHLGQLNAMVWTFPTDGRTFVYQEGVGWGQWAGWNTGTNNFQRFGVNCHHQRADTGANVVGMTDGKVGELDLGTYTDLGDQISARVETGYLDRDTSKRKQCKALYLSIRNEGTAIPQALVSWRDDSGGWNAPIAVEFPSGNTEFEYPLYSLGVYRRRQWRFEFSGSSELVLLRAREEFVLED